MSRILEILSQPAEEAELFLDAAFVAQNQGNIDWLVDRLAKSTAGVRGLIASTPHLTELSLETAEKTPQLSPTVVALIAQAYALYFLETNPQGAGAFVGFDARFLSAEFGDIFTRVFAGNGVRVVRDHHGEATPTPVTSFMAIYRKLDGGIQITASHNPPNHNGVKSSTCYGGVDTDDISDKIASQIHGLVGGGGIIRFGSRFSPLVDEVDAKGEYCEAYLKATFPGEALEPLRKAIDAGAGFLFDGLHGVGGSAMQRYLDMLLPEVDWRRSVHLLNAAPDPSIGGIEKPDPSDPNTLVLSGAIAHLSAHPEVLVSVTADMDADRIGTAVLIPASEVARARKFGLFVSAFDSDSGGGIHAVRFTPNQVFTLIAYDRLLTATGCSPALLAESVREGRIAGSRFHVLTTIATSVIAEQLARTYGLSFHLTAVGFKNLGKEAMLIDRKRSGDIILALLEESGGAQIGPFRAWSADGDTIHRDKDTCALALALFNLAARLKQEGRGVLDFYLEMAEQFGALAYFERLDAYLPDRATAEDPHQADVANRVKAEMLERLVALDARPQADKLLSLLGYDPSELECEPEEDIAEISLLIKTEGEWKTVHPRARRYRAPNGERVEFYRAGPFPHDGMRINVYDPEGAIRHWTLIRASGTEALLRVYMEIAEPLDNPDPTRLDRQFRPLLEYLGLNNYRLEPGKPDYAEDFRRVVEEKYAT